MAEDPNAPDFFPVEQDSTPDFFPVTPENLQGYAAQQTTPVPPGLSHRTGFTGPPLTSVDAAAAKAHGTYGPGVPAGYFEKQMGETERQQLGQQLGHEPSWWDIAKSEGKNLATAGAYVASAIAAPGGSGVMGALGRTATTGGLAGLTSYLQGGTPTDIAISTGFGLGMQGLGEALTPAEAATPTASKFVARLLNASGKITPETLANLQAAEPALRSMPAPAKMTPAGAAEGFRQGSRAIDSQIQAIIKPAANADVSDATATIAQNLRGRITPKMREINKGAANAIEKLASSIEDSKTLGSLDDLRQQMNEKIYSIRSNSVFTKYAKMAHSDVLDAIAEQAQKIRPDLAVRSLRSQQAGLMNLAEIFEESGAKGQALATMKQGMSLRQRAATGAQEMVSAYLNPREALMRRLMKPGTSEGYLRSAFGGNRPAATLDIGPPPTQSLSTPIGPAPASGDFPPMSDINQQMRQDAISQLRQRLQDPSTDMVVKQQLRDDIDRLSGFKVPTSADVAARSEAAVTRKMGEPNVATVSSTSPTAIGADVQSTKIAAQRQALQQIGGGKSFSELTSAEKKAYIELASQMETHFLRTGGR